MDVPAAYGLGDRPFWFVVAALIVIVLARSHGTYWLARGAVRGASRLHPERLHPERLSPDRLRPAPSPGRSVTVRERVLAWSTTPSARRAQATLHRLGPLAVAFAYLTVGAQTAVFAAAGLSRMSYVRFSAASLPGAVAWAFIWGTVGLGAVWGAIAVAARSGWALGAALATAAGLVVWVRRRRRTA